MQEIKPEDLIIIDIETAPVCASYETLSETWNEHCRPIPFSTVSFSFALAAQNIE